MKKKMDVIGLYCTTAFSAVALGYDAENDTWHITDAYASHHGTQYKVWRPVKLRYSSKGEYVMHHGCRYYTHDFMRVE